MPDERDRKGPQIVTTIGVARELGVHPDTVAKYARTGELPSRWILNRRVFDMREVETWLASRAQRRGARAK